MESIAAKTLIDTVLQPENLGVVVGCWVLLSTIARMAPELSSRSWWARMQPLLPLVLCTAALWIPGAAQAEMAAADKILLGLLLGFAVGHAHKIMRQTGLGDDERITPPVSP